MPLTTPLHPFSRYPADDPYTYPRVFLGDGEISRGEGPGLGFSADVGDAASNPVWELRFPTPPVRPAGTPKILVTGLTIIEDTTGLQSAQLDLKWTPVGVGEDPSNPSLALKSAGVTLLSFAGTATDGEYVQIEFLLDETGGYTIAGGDIIVVELSGIRDTWGLDEGVTLWAWLIFRSTTEEPEPVSGLTIVRYRLMPGRATRTRPYRTMRKVRYYTPVPDVE